MPIEAKSVVNLKWSGPEQVRSGPERHYAQEIAAVEHQVARLRQQSVELDARGARIERAGRVLRLEVARRVEVRQQVAGLLDMERLFISAPFPHRFQQLFGHQPGIADDRDVGGRPLVDGGPVAVDLHQRRLGQGFAEAGGKEIQPRAEHQCAVGLLDQPPPGGMREGADDAGIVRVAAEHGVAARRGRQHRARMLGQALQHVLGVAPVRAEAGDDQWPFASFEQRGGRPDCLVTARLRRVRRHLPCGRGGVLRHFQFGQLHRGRQQQRGRTPLGDGGERVGHGRPRCLGAGRDEGPEAGGVQHAHGVEALVVRTERVDGAVGDRRLAVNDQHPVAAARGEDRAVQAVRRRRPAADQRDAGPPRRRGIAVGGRNGDVLVPRALELDADGIQRHSESRRVVAHQAEHDLDAVRPQILREYLVGGDLAATDLAATDLAALFLPCDRHGVLPLVVPSGGSIGSGANGTKFAVANTGYDRSM